MTTVPTEDGNSTPAEQSSGAAGGELVVARLDEATGEIVIPTPVAGGFLRFSPGAKLLTDDQHVILGPLGIRRDWEPAAVLHFLMDAARRGFDPYGKEIFLLRYQSRQGPAYVHHIGIHGMERHVEETGLFGGIQPVRFCGDDGKWLEVWSYKDAAPYACKVIMRRRDWDMPLEKIGYYDEFAPLVDEWKDNVKTGEQVPSPMWRPAGAGGKPTLMLSKCTRALAFREGWPARFTNWYEPAEMDRMRVESDQLISEARDDRADRRAAAYAAAQGGKTVDGDALGVTVTDAGGPDTMPADRVRAMLLAELDAQAAIVGETRAFLVRRWQETRGGRSFDTATIGEVAAHVALIRPYVVAELRKQGRHELADRYAEATSGPDTAPATLVELFGVDQVAALARDEQKVAA